MTSTNPADYTNEELRGEIERGGRLVVFPYCVSLIVITLRRNSRPHVIPAGQGSFVLSLPWSLISLFFGWWGIPWGLIYTPVALWQSLGGGVDLTDEWRNNYDEAVRVEKAKRLAALQEQHRQSSAHSGQPAPAPPVRAAPAPSPLPASFRSDSTAPASFREGDAHGSHSTHSVRNTRPPPLAAAFKAVCVFVAVAFVAYLCLGYWTMRSTRTVTLINGLGAAYEVTFNGASYECPAATKDGGSVSHIELAPGRYEVRATLPNSQEFHTTADIGPLSIWNWPGKLNRAVMINADRLALVYREKISYTARSKPASKNSDKTPDPIEFFLNQGVINIRKPDYYFKDAPDTLYIKKNASSTRTHVGILRGLTVPQAINTVRKYGTPGDTAAYAARASLLHGNAAMDTLMSLIEEMDPEDVRKIFTQQLDTRPVNVQWHRYYQQYAGIKYRDIDLVEEYRARLAADPQNGALNYLLARILPDRAEARALYEKALVAPAEPCAYAHNGLAYEALRDGDYAKALDYFEKSAAADLQSRHIEERLNLLVAFNRANEALALASEWFRQNPSDLGLASNAMLFLGVCKRPSSEATRTLLAYTSAAGKSMSKTGLANCRAYLEASYSYGSGNEKRYAEQLEKLARDESWGDLALFRALTLGDHATAASQLASAKHARPGNWFLAAIVAHITGDCGAADAYYAKGIAALRDSALNSCKIAAALESARDSAPDVATLREHTSAPDETRVLFCLLGFRHSAQRDAFWREARAANYAPGFPHLLLKRAMSE